MTPTQRTLCRETVWVRSHQVKGWGRNAPCSKLAGPDGLCGTHRAKLKRYTL